MMTFSDFLGELAATRNWNRWGADDAAGATNLIDATKVREAAKLVVQGEVISLARSLLPFRGEATEERGAPYRQELEQRDHDGDGAYVDVLTFDYHGPATTHIDALSHLWSQGHMWNGDGPESAISDEGLISSDVHALANGIVTRGILLDIPELRGTQFVTEDDPVTADELAAAAAAQRVSIGPGDALAVYCGREAWETVHGPWGGSGRAGQAKPSVRPGLDASCTRFIRETDVAVLVWDMMDARPNAFGTRWTVHRILAEFGVPLVDNASLTHLAERCAARGTWEFLLTIAPLPLRGATGSPVNPVAIL